MHLASFLLAVPWVLVPLVTVLRARHSRSLDDEHGAPPRDPPLVSLVIPARNESRNIRRCVQSALASEYPRLEVIVVDDDSTDDTGAIVRALAEHDARLRVMSPPALPAGWFGKQWACNAGAAMSAGDIIGFMDADTVQSTDLITRVVNAMTARGADMLSVAGTQEMGGMWERLVQPQIFTILLQRYGGTESVNRSRFATQKIANGQCLWLRREAHDALGGHAAARDKVAEDLALAQRYFSAGRTVTLVLGLEQLSTRMYTSLSEVVAGWGKNIYAGGRDAMPFGAIGRALLPVLLVLPAAFWLGPPIVLTLALAHVMGQNALQWAALATGANVVWWMLVYRWLRLPPLYGLLYPLGSAVLLYIALGAIGRGRRVRWKGREYRAG